VRGTKERAATVLISATSCLPGFEIESIVALISENPEFNRAQLSRQVCEMLHWRRPDGRLKDMSCRVAMLRMQDEGLLQLPAPRNGNNNGKSYQRRTLFA
jgi:hypothetical protein